jgi:hypothetical protein
VAISDPNLANNLASPADDAFRDGHVMDFPGVLVDSSTQRNQNVAFRIAQASGRSVQMAAVKHSVYEVVFARFTVGQCACDFNGDGVLNSQDFFDFLACFFAGGCL